MRQWADDLGVPDLTKLLQQFGRNLADQFNCHRVGRITAFDSNTLVCKVKLLDKLIFNGTEEDYVEFTNMPLLIYATETAGLTLGNVVGAECLVHFNDTDIDNWLQTGEAYAPNSLRSHDFNDGFVELRPFDHLAAQKISYDTTAVVLRNRNVKIKLTDGGQLILDNQFTSATGDVDVAGTVTAANVIPRNGYSGTVTVGTKVMSFANGILISVTPEG